MTWFDCRNKTIVFSLSGYNLTQIQFWKKAYLLKNISSIKFMNKVPKCEYGPLHDFSSKMPIFKRVWQPDLCSHTHQSSGSFRIDKNYIVSKFHKNPFTHFKIMKHFAKHFLKCYKIIISKVKVL